MSNNGESNVAEGLTIEEKLDLLLEGLAEVSEKQDEIIEKLSNVSLPGTGYEVEEFDS